LKKNTFGEFPLQEWSFVTKEKNLGVLKIKGRSSSIVIEINEGKTRVVEPKLNFKTMEGDTWLPPTYLFKVRILFIYCY
jgi:hypothetical protein